MGKLSLTSCLFFLLLSACSPTEKQPDTKKSELHKQEKTIEKTEQSAAIETRNQAAMSEMLQHSFLQEFYQRKVVRVTGDSITVKISFNLHSPDCGAPDCYTTEVRFGFRPGKEFNFPKHLKFRESEDGCIEETYTLNSMFELVEQTDKHVIYHCPKVKRTLVLFRSATTTGTGAYYFTYVDRKTVTGKNLYTIMSNYKEEDKNALYPFTSTDLSAIIP